MSKSKKSFVQTKEAAAGDRKWYVVDASDKTLGRLASQIATVIRGKHKPEFTPHVDCGDFVIVINAEKVGLTGAKRADKRYYRHSGYVGGIRSESVEDALEKHPERVIERAVKGMIPRGALGHQMIKKLKVYAGDSHPHGAQQPLPFEMPHAA